MLKRRGLIGAFIAVFLGVTMLTMAALLLDSARPKVPDRLAAAEILIQPAVPWSSSEADTLATQLESIPGVTAAIPDTPFSASGQIGNSYAAAALGGLRLTAGAAPTTPHQVAMAGHRPGDIVTVTTATGPRDYTVSGTVDGPGIYFAETPHLGVSAIGLLTSGTVNLAQVSALAGPAKVLTGDARSALEPAEDTYTRWVGMQVLTAVGALSGFTAVFLVASTFAFSVLQRRRELGLLRAVGATPRQVRRMLLREATLIGAVGGLAGVVLGALLAPVMGALLIDAGFQPPTFEIRYAFLPLAGAYLAGLIVALAGVVAASARAARVTPLEALRAADAERRPMTRSRWIFGGLAAALGVLFAIAAANAEPLSLPTLAGATVMALVTAMSLLAPALVPPLTRIPLLGGAIGLLVRQNAQTSARRTASIAAPVLLTVAFATLVMGMVQTTAGAFAAHRADAIPFPAALVPDRGAPGLTDAVVAANPGLAVLPTTLHLGDSELPATGLSSVDFSGLTVTPAIAAEHGWTDGTQVTLTVANGQEVPFAVRVASSHDGIVIPWADARAYDPAAMTQVVFLEAVPPAVPPGVKVLDSQTYAAQADAEEDRLVWSFTLILVGMALGFALIGVANTLLMARAGRVRDLLVLARAGATKRQLRLLQAAENSLVILLGTGLGLAVAIPGLLAIRAGLSEQVGVPIPLVLPWPLVALVVAACLGVAVGIPMPRLSTEDR